jgi:predicted Zn-dependent peptidase
VTAAAQSAVFRNVIARSSEQAHLVMGFGAFENSDPLRFAGALINGYLGGGLTSKLYQSVREDRGLVYSIFSQMNSFRGAGVCTIYAGTDAKKIPQVVELILKELRALKRNGIKKADLEFFKTQVLGALMLSADDIENRMNALGSNEMFLGTYRSIDEVMRDVKAVDLAAVHECIETRLKLDAVSMLTMGPMSQKSMEKRLRAL